MRRVAIVACLLAGTAWCASDTPALKLKLKNDSPLEQRKKEQIERLAKQYDLKKYTITREIIIEQGVRPHSSPVLTLNGRFLDNDDLTLSQYCHEQGHWVLMERHRRDLPYLYNDLKRLIPSLPTEFPQGSGDERGTYFHLAVIMLEWQALEELVGAERARAALEWKSHDHYTAIYPAVLEKREELQKIMKRYAIKW
jgi:hypothetical protein